VLQAFHTFSETKKLHKLLCCCWKLLCFQ